jgi:hypothetical protein
MRRLALALLTAAAPLGAQAFVPLSPATAAAYCGWFIADGRAPGVLLISPEEESVPGFGTAYSRNATDVFWFGGVRVSRDSARFTRTRVLLVENGDTAWTAWRENTTVNPLGSRRVQLRALACTATGSRDVTRLSTTRWAMSPSAGASIGVSTGLVTLKNVHVAKVRVQVCYPAPYRPGTTTRYCPVPPVPTYPTLGGVPMDTSRVAPMDTTKAGAMDTTRAVP